MKEKEEKDLFVEVALPVSLFMTFTYKLPPDYSEKQLVGRRVLVPFRNTKMTGIITGTSSSPEYKNIKQIESFPDEEPVFTQEYVRLIKEISEYYISPIGITAYYAMPEGLRWKYNTKTGRWIKPVSEEKVYVPNIVTLAGVQKLSEKALKLLEFILENGEITKNQVKEYGFSESSLKTLLKKGYIKEEKFIFKEEKVIRNKKLFTQSPVEKGIYIYSCEPAEKRLNRYIQISLKNIKEGRSTLIIFPNIRTIKEVYPELKKVFGDKLFVYFDLIPEKEKIKTWFNLKKLEGTLTIGTHPSLFIPVKNLSTVIIEEEYSEAYKNQRSPRYDARRVAAQIYRIKKDISVIYSGSALSLESYYILEKKSGKELVRGKISKNKKAKITLRRFSPEHIIDSKVMDFIKNEKGSFLIITNRKGYASFLYCPRCEDEIKCGRCDIPVKVYTKNGEKFLRCDICGKKYSYLKSCTVCKTPLKEVGFGIEKVEKLIRRYTVNSSIQRIDILTNLSGKEFIAKDYDYVININPDIFLYIPDFRGGESFFRSIYLPYLKARKEYIILTNQKKEDTAVKAVLNKKPEIFYREELKKREISGYPPFARLILLTFEKRDLSINTVEEILKKWTEKSGIQDMSIEGPFLAYHHTARERKRVQILLKNFKEKEKIIDLYRLSAKKGIKLIIDVDPRKIF
ncbi:primosomal protein N' family DNA-binding protein [Persephonella sp.]